MPELPEVETIRRTLEHLIAGKTVEKVDVFWPKMIKRPDDAKEFARLLEGKTVQTIARRGKFLKFVFDDTVLVSHLRMEGRYSVHSEPKEPKNKHVHVIFTFTDGTELRYQDVRKFGTMHLFPKGEEERFPPLSELGVEPFSKQFTLEFLYHKLQKTKRTIKTTLLDQKIVVGIGNIYADEALFRAGIHPLTAASEIAKDKAAALHEAIRMTLKKAVEEGGTTVRSYVNGAGDMGMFQQYLYVYGRKNEPCRRCQTMIEKIKVGGRGTHYCPKCQK